MLVSGIPGEPDVVARMSLAETVLPHGNRLSLDLAQNDAVGAEMFDGLYARRMTVLRHDADMFRPDTDQPVASREIKFIGGVPMNRAVNAVAGRLYNCSGVPFCSTRPSRINTTRSAMVMASVWSCVT